MEAPATVHAGASFMPARVGGRARDIDHELARHETARNKTAPMTYLVSMQGWFDRKTVPVLLNVPFVAHSLRIRNDSAGAKVARTFRSVGHFAGVKATVSDFENRSPSSSQ